MMKPVKFQCFIFLIFSVGVKFILAVPTSTINLTNPRSIHSPSNYVEIKLPVEVTTRDQLIDWIKNAMQTMASKIDITLASQNQPEFHQESSKIKDTMYKNVETKMKHKPAMPRNTFINVDSPWLNGGSEIPSPLIDPGAFFPLILGNAGSKFSVNDLQKYVYNGNKGKIVTTTERTAKITEFDKQPNNLESSSEFIRDTKDSKTLNSSRILPGHVPFAIPFDAYLTITHELSTDNQQQQQQQQLKTPETRDPPDDFPPYFEKVPASIKKNSTIVKMKSPTRYDKDEHSRKRQIAVLGDILQMLGLTRKVKSKSKTQEAATTSTITLAGPINKPRKEFTSKPSFDFEHPSPRPRRNDTSERQEFDEDEDEDYEEEQGSLGSIADLIPLALPVLEDLSNPESETDLIELLQAAVPLIQGLSEPDDDGTGGANELIAMIVPIVTKIVRGKDGEGSDIGALIGPVFGLLAPFIGPVLAPVIGPLIRTISNPPTEGSSLGALITAITGPLSTPQEPSGMSPLSIVIAGATAGVLKELNPGAVGGSDLGALVGAILSGVIAGTSAGLSGGSSGTQDAHDQPGYGPYTVDLKAPQVSGTFNTGFTRRPSPGPPLNSPFNIVRRNRPVSTVNIGSIVRPSPLNYSPKPPVYVQQHTRPSPAPYAQSRPQSYSHLHGPIPAAATYGQSDSYHPTGSTAVPASSVNPLSLISSSVTSILGAGVQVVSSLVNAVFGIIGASSESPAPSYGAYGTGKRRWPRPVTHSKDY